MNLYKNMSYSLKQKVCKFLYRLINDQHAEEKLGPLMFSGLAYKSKRWEWHWRAADLNMDKKMF